MTAAEFRSSPVRVAAARELLNDPTFATMLVVLRDERPDLDDSLAGDAVGSVRILNRAFGHDNAVNTLLSLAEPLPPEPEQPMETFGVPLSQLTPQTDQ